jgi:DNA mismatch repair ATPase MutS
MEKRGSLLWVLDKTKTAMGKRMLHSFLLRPLIDPVKISKRQAAVSDVLESRRERDLLGEYFAEVLDIERLTARAVYGTANARDLKAICQSIKCLPDIKACISGFTSNSFKEIVRDFDTLDDIYELLEKAEGINFVGNIEANMVPKDTCDVLVTDGFTGNVLLKSIEGMGKMMLRTMKDIFYANIKAKVSALLIKKKLDEVKTVFDPNEHGGAPILGIAKPVIKAHGSSNAKAVKNAMPPEVDMVYFN